MKITSSEKIIEPVEEATEEIHVEQPIIKRKMEKKEQKTEEVNNQEPMNKSPEPPILNKVEDFDKDSVAKEKIERKEMPGVQQAYLNPNELKEIAIKLMPTVDKLMHNIYEPLNRDTMRNVSEAAINMAFEFLQVWSEKISIGG